MKKSLIICVALILALLALPVAALAAEDAESPTGPVLADDGSSFTYKGETTQLGPHALYVDGKLTDEEIADLDYVFNTFNDAVENLTDGTEDEPMNLYLAPYVYWIHDPNAEEATDMIGNYQMEINCANLHITGLSDDARDVVVAANFGHDVGFMGANYTMFRVTGDGLTLKDMTFGDYCNVDLEYPLDPSLNVPKRTTNVTQGQIASYSGDKLYAENVRFVSRLNMMPFNNSGRALYVNCHLESTDDSLNGSSKAVYLNCDFEFYSSKPWGGSSGVTILNSTMKIVPQYTDPATTDTITQYLAKGYGPYTVIDSEFVSNFPNAAGVEIGWSDLFDATFKSYYSNVTHNGEQITFSAGARDDAGVDLTGKDALQAFKLTTEDGEVIYNIYNLLRGDDDWDPLGQKEAVTEASASDFPTFMRAYIVGENDARSTSATIESGKDTVNLIYVITGPQSTDYTAAANVTWTSSDADGKYVKLTVNEDGSCTVEGVNEQEETVQVIITAVDASGLEGAVALTVRPSVLSAPELDGAPVITQNSDGTASVSYTYTDETMGGRDDNSRITWYVSDSADGSDPIEIAVGRSDTPLSAIDLNGAYVGKYLVVKIESKHIRSDYGEAVTAVSAQPVSADGIPDFDGKLDVNLDIFPTVTQDKVLPGFWTVDSYKPADADKDTGSFPGGWTGEADGASKWAYGVGGRNGFDGAVGIYNTDRGARLKYTPLVSTAGNMELIATLAPGKTASQGFGSANQYMDFMIKYDTENNVGYGLRIYRTSGSDCGFVLVKHTADGDTELLTYTEVSKVLLTETTVRVWSNGDRLNALVTSTGIDETVFLTTTVSGLSAVTSSGIEINHTGTGGDNSIYVTSLGIQWTDELNPEPDIEVPEFTDVPEDAWYAGPVNWAIAKGITVGTSDTTFEPETVCTKAEILTMLWRALGEPKAAAASPIAAGDDYQDAIDWAYDQRIIGADFNPDAPCTRADAVMYIWLVKEMPVVEEASSFTDMTGSESYAKAVNWAVANGVTAGYEDGTFRPGSFCTRGHIVTFLYRAYVQPYKA